MTPAPLATTAATRIFLILLCVGSTSVRVLGGETDAEYYQRLTARLEWTWDPGEASIFFSMSQYADEYQIEIICSQGPVRNTTIRVAKADRVICSWVGAPYSVFVQKGKILVYAVYSNDSSGCTLIAVDLDTGKELWKTQLQALGFVEHSGYNNGVTVSLGDDGIFVHGNETSGKYIEILDLKTGKTLGHKAFPANEKNRQPPGQ